jgi:transcription initiation factor TFIIB
MLDNINIYILLFMWNLFDSFHDNERDIDISDDKERADDTVVDTVQNNTINKLPSKTTDQYKIDNVCTSCTKSELIYDSGAYYCSSCGLFQKKMLNQKYQHNNFYNANNVNPCRVGSATNILLPKSSLGSLINSKHTNYNYNKMAKYNSWNAMPYKERSQWKIFTQITEACTKNKLPKIIIEDSKIYYKHLSENIISRGSNRKGLIAACVFNACKKQTVPRSCKEIAEMFGIELKEITKGCKKFNELWRLVNTNSDLTKNTTYNRSSNPLDYIDRFCSKLNIPIDLKYIAEIVSIKAITSIYNIVNDNTSPSISAGSIYFVCLLYSYTITKKQISDVSKISEVTISKCYKKLNMYKKYLLPKTILQELNL